MACLVAVNFSSFTLFTSHTELHTKQRAHRLFSSIWSRTTTRASFSLISSTYIRRYTSTSSLSSVDLFRVTSRDMSVLLPFHTDVSYCPRTLCGYWVGPDMEDSWGFVEAFISDNFQQF